MKVHVRARQFPAWLLSGCLAAGLAAAAQQPARPAFRGGVDLITVDATVLDAGGAPVRDLRAEEFTVTVDGRPRRLVAVEFIDQRADAVPNEELPEGATAAAGAAPRHAISTNEGPAGRLVMIVVDAAGVRFGGVRRAAEAVRRLVGQLGPRDRLGLAIIPVPGVVVPLSAEHARAVEAMTRVAGEAMRHVPVTRQQVGWSEALAFSRGPENPEWLAAVDRECAGTTEAQYLACVATLENEANQMLAWMVPRVREFEVGMRQVFRGLASIDAPKTVVLVTEGLITSSRTREDVSLAADAAAARTTVYVVRLDTTWFPDASERSARPTTSADRELARLVLDGVAARTGGRLFDVMGSAEGAFERVALELSGSYLLGLEPEPGDRDGRAHQIRVEVARPGVTVRARREFTIGKEIVNAPAAGRARDEDEVRRMLAAPLPVGELPIRLATYNSPVPDRSKVRVLVTAEIGRGRTAPEELALGFVLFDPAGRARGGVTERVTLTPLGGRGAGALSYVGDVTVEPGHYILKLAAVDRSGQRGSIEHPAEARLAAAGPLVVGDLILGRPPAADAVLLPPVEPVVEGEEVFIYLQLGAAQSRALSGATATVEIATDEDGPPLVSSPVRLIEAKGGQRNVQVAIAVSLLPPGTYVARARLDVGGRPVGRALRRFTFAPSPEVAAAAGRAGGAMARGRVPVSGFAVNLVLAAEVVGPLVEAMTGIGASLANEVVTALREGRFADAERLASGQTDADAGPPFVRGLHLLARGQIETAANEFRRSLRASPDAFPAAFYLGACYALGGRDDEAAGAWQTSLVGLEAYPIVYRVLIDAWLREGEPAEARALAEEGSARWPGDDTFRPRLAAALAMAGENEAALAVLGAYLDRRGGNDDVPALFLAIRLLYEQAADRPAGERAAFIERLTGYAARYRAAGGPDHAIVAAWVKAVAAGR